MMMLTAHSGCDDTPMNSLEYLHHAADLPVDAVEIDVRRGEDGTLILTHDKSDSSVTMAQCLEILKNTGKMINADLKEPGLETDLLELASRIGFAAERIIFTGCVSDPATMKDRVAPAQVFFNLEEIDPDFYQVVGESGPDYLEKVLAAVAAFGYPAVNINYRILTDAFAACCRKLRLEISAWTVNDPEDMQRVASLGVINITTRRPGLWH